jgi:hypothetical protein
MIFLLDEPPPFRIRCLVFTGWSRIFRQGRGLCNCLPAQSSDFEIYQRPGVKSALAIRKDSGSRECYLGSLPEFAHEGPMTVLLAEMFAIGLLSVFYFVIWISPWRSVLLHKPLVER